MKSLLAFYPNEPGFMNSALTWQKNRDQSVNLLAKLYDLVRVFIAWLDWKTGTGLMLFRPKHPGASC